MKLFQYKINFIIFIMFNLLCENSHAESDIDFSRDLASVTLHNSNLTSMSQAKDHAVIAHVVKTAYEGHIFPDELKSLVQSSENSNQFNHSVETVGVKKQYSINVDFSDRNKADQFALKVQSHLKLQGIDVSEGDFSLGYKKGKTQVLMSSEAMDKLRLLHKKQEEFLKEQVGEMPSYVNAMLDKKFGPPGWNNVKRKAIDLALKSAQLHFEFSPGGAHKMSGMRIKSNSNAADIIKQEIVNYFRKENVNIQNLDSYFVKEAGGSLWLDARLVREFFNVVRKDKQSPQVNLVLESVFADSLKGQDFKKFIPGSAITYSASDPGVHIKLPKNFKDQFVGKMSQILDPSKLEFIVLGEDFYLSFDSVNKIKEKILANVKENSILDLKKYAPLEYTLNESGVSIQGKTLNQSVFEDLKKSIPDVNLRSKLSYSPKSGLVIGVGVLHSFVKPKIDQTNKDQIKIAIQSKEPPSTVVQASLEKAVVTTDLVGSVLIQLKETEGLNAVCEAIKDVVSEGKEASGLICDSKHQSIQVSADLKTRLSMIAQSVLDRQKWPDRIQQVASQVVLFFKNHFLGFFGHQGVKE